MVKLLTCRLHGITLLFITIMMFVFISCQRNTSEMENKNEISQEVQKEDIVNTSRKLPVMLELGSIGCQACKKMESVIDSLNSEYPSLINIEFHDVKKDREIARKYKIRLIPTQVFINKEGQEHFRHEGYYSSAEILAVFREMGVNI